MKTIVRTTQHFRRDTASLTWTPDLIWWGSSQWEVVELTVPLEVSLLEASKKNSTWRRWSFSVDLKNQLCLRTKKSGLMWKDQFHRSPPCHDFFYFLVKGMLPQSLVFPAMCFHHWMATGCGGCWEAGIRERLNAQCSSGWLMIGPLSRYSAAESTAPGKSNFLYRYTNKWHCGADVNHRPTTM